MADKPAAEKTEQPTYKRLSKAKKKGQSPQSMELMSFFSIVILMTSLCFMASEMIQWFNALIEEGMSCEVSIFNNTQTFLDMANRKITECLIILCPILGALCLGSVTSGIIVSGLNFAPGAIKLDFESLSPAAGLGKLFNTKSLVKLLMSILKFFFMSIIVWSYLRDKLEILACLRWAWSLNILAFIAKIILGLIIRVSIALLILGLADVIYQKRKYIKDLKMTKQEVKEERKQSEGAPEVKSRIRKIQFTMAAKRMLQDVPKASVVLVNPTHVAVALRYDTKTMEAPIVVAKGADHLAAKIREIAEAYGVPIVQKPELARTLYSTVELKDPIPAGFYVAVAEILAMIHRLRQRKG